MKTEEEKPEPINPNWMPLAYELARFWHKGQLDQNKDDYLHHLVDVRSRLQHRSHVHQIVGMLHDILEDTLCPVDILKIHFSTEIVNAVLALTRRPGESRIDYYARVKANPIALVVKVEGDIPSNLNPARLETLPEDVRTRLVRKYAEALKVLNS